MNTTAYLIRLPNEYKTCSPSHGRKVFTVGQRSQSRHICYNPFSTVRVWKLNFLRTTWQTACHCLLPRRNGHAPDGRAIALMTLNDTFRKNWVPFAVLIEIGWLSSYLGIISVVMVIYPGFAPIVQALIVHFTVTGGNEVRGDGLF